MLLEKVPRPPEGQTGPFCDSLPGCGVAYTFWVSGPCGLSFALCSKEHSSVLMGLSSVIWDSAFAHVNYSV